MLYEIEIFDMVNEPPLSAVAVVEAEKDPRSGLRHQFQRAKLAREKKSLESREQKEHLAMALALESVGSLGELDARLMKLN